MSHFCSLGTKLHDSKHSQFLPPQKNHLKDFDGSRRKMEKCRLIFGALMFPSKAAGRGFNESTESHGDADLSLELFAVKCTQRIRISVGLQRVCWGKPLGPGLEQSHGSSHVSRLSCAFEIDFSDSQCDIRTHDIFFHCSLSSSGAFLIFQSLPFASTYTAEVV